MAHIDTNTHCWRISNGHEFAHLSAYSGAVDLMQLRGWHTLEKCIRPGVWVLQDWSSTQ